MNFQLISPEDSGEGFRYKVFFDEDVVIPESSSIYLNNAVLTRKEGVTFSAKQTMTLSDVALLGGPADSALVLTTLDIDTGNYTFKELRDKFKEFFDKILTDNAAAAQGDLEANYQTVDTTDSDNNVLMGINQNASMRNITFETTEPINLNMTETSDDRGYISTIAKDVDFNAFVMGGEAYFHNTNRFAGETLSSEEEPLIPRTIFRLVNSSGALTVNKLKTEHNADGQTRIMMGFYGEEYANDATVGTGTRTDASAIANVPVTGTGGAAGGLRTIRFVNPAVDTFETAQAAAGGNITATPENLTITGNATVSFQPSEGKIKTVSITDKAGNNSSAVFEDGETCDIEGGVTVGECTVTVATGTLADGTGITPTSGGSGMTNGAAQTFNIDVGGTPVTGAVATGNVAGGILTSFDITTPGTGTVANNALLTLTPTDAVVTSKPTFQITAGDGQVIGVITAITVTNAGGDFDVEKECRLETKRGSGTEQTFVTFPSILQSDLSTVDSVFRINTPGSGYTPQQALTITGATSASTVGAVVLTTTNSDLVPTAFLAVEIFTEELQGAIEVLGRVLIADNSTTGTPKLWTTQKKAIDTMKPLRTFNVADVFQSDEQINFIFSSFVEGATLGTNTADIQYEIVADSIGGKVKVIDSKTIGEEFFSGFFEGLGRSTAPFRASQLPFSPIIATNSINHGAECDLSSISNSGIPPEAIVKSYQITFTQELADVFGVPGTLKSPEVFPNCYNNSYGGKKALNLLNFERAYRLQSYAVRILNLPIMTYKNVNKRQARGYKQPILHTLPAPFSNDSETSILTIDEGDLVSVAHQPRFQMIKRLENQRIATNYFDVLITHLEDDTPATEIEASAFNFTII